MEEESVISVNSTNVSREGSDSPDRFQFHNQSARPGTTVSTSRFKGVICQANGHWGAQIYVNHQRIWLGTFKSEKEAAMAYDSAALKLRSGDSHRNVPWTNITVQEPNFQSQFSTEAVLDMIKGGSYAAKFADYLRAHVQNGRSLPSVYPNGEVMGEQLFRKELTPSDVGKLNRLVIPKKFAIKYFPLVSDNDQEKREGGTGVQDTDLVFYDRSKRSWKFRYCYWKSSQSYVFTRGWNRFVKDKGLRAKDVVTFSVLERKDGSNKVENLSMIDVEYSDAATCSAEVEDTNHMEEKLLLDMRLSYPYMSCYNQATGSSSEAEYSLEENAYLQEEICFGSEQIGRKHKGLRLFGVQIV